ncbi:hypothetical protein FB446DRAFT_708177 [Lentinula raphanica]|nr:hypothetical protein FB446DRAFT_708177 [Lentinula raphanica]
MKSRRIQHSIKASTGTDQFGKGPPTNVTLGPRAMAQRRLSQESQAALNDISGLSSNGSLATDMDVDGVDNGDSTFEDFTTVTQDNEDESDQPPNITHDLQDYIHLNRTAGTTIRNAGQGRRTIGTTRRGFRGLEAAMTRPANYNSSSIRTSSFLTPIMFIPDLNTLDNPSAPLFCTHTGSDVSTSYSSPRLSVRLFPIAISSPSARIYLVWSS